MTTPQLNLDPLEARILEAFCAALAEFTPDSDWTEDIQKQINQIGQDLAAGTTTSIEKLIAIAKENQAFYSFFLRL